MNETMRRALQRAMRRYDHKLLAMLEKLVDKNNRADVHGRLHEGATSRIESSFLEHQLPNKSLFVQQSMFEFLNTTSESIESNAEDQTDYTRLSMKVCFNIVYLVIFVLGLVGNALICFVVARNSSMHTVTNVFIANLALSDILLCLFAVPITWLYLVVYEHWIFGKLLCHLLPFAQGVSVYISTLTLMSIAIDRYFVILYPFRSRMPMQTCLVVIVAIWIVSCVLTSPYAFFMRIDVNDAGLFYCQEKWPWEATKTVFSVFTFIMQFLVPLVIITLCYYRICSKLWDRAKAIPGNVSARREEQERERTRRTNWMLISMVVIFAVSWSPLNIYNLLADFYIVEFYTEILLVAHAFAMASACYNPFLYAWLNENFRKEFKDILPYCFRASRLTTTIVQYRKPRHIAVCRDEKKGVSTKLVEDDFKVNGSGVTRNAENRAAHQEEKLNYVGDKESNSTSKGDASLNQVTSDSPLPS